MLRHPAVAGSFYPASASKLKTEIEKYIDPSVKRSKAIALVVPHAGYRYSGPVAGATFSRVDLPDHFIILSPNHTGFGKGASIWPEGEWELPFGPARVDAALSKRLMQNCPLLEEDTEAHLQEHSLEVELPFLQYLKKDFTFVPLTLMRGDPKVLQEIGLAIAKTIRESGQTVLIVASSDMNHYESQEIAQKKDRLAIDKILALDPDGLLQTVAENRISMCGIIPTTVALHAAKALGARRAELVRHATSGDVTGDYGSVVGYAGLIVT